MEITVKEISDRLARDCERVCQLLLPSGKIDKNEWICGDINGSNGKSLKVHLSGTHAGNWRDWADSNEMHGDLLDLWRLVRGTTPADTVKQAKEWLGISDRMGPVAERTYGKPKENKDIKLLNPAGRACEFLTKKRGISVEIVNRFKVSGDGKNIVFPSYDPSGALINRSYRTLTEPKEVWQDTGCAPCLFGWHALPESIFQSRTILLCEGQIDAMTWTQWGIPALSLPNGTGRTWIEFEWDNLAAFDQIYVSFDMDGAGRENAEQCIYRLGKHRCLIVSLPEKDANACLQKGHSAEDAKGWLAESKPPKIKGLLKAIELEQRLLQSLQPRKECFTLPFLKADKFGGGYYPRPEEVTAWTGVTGHGKTTFLNFLIMSAVLSSLPVFVCSLETKAEVSLKKMMTSFFGKPPCPEDVTQFLAEVGHGIVFADVVGYISQEELMEKMLFCQRRWGVQHCIIDSFMRVEGLEEDYVAQGKFLNRLQEFAKNTGVHVHLVVHPRKMADDGKPGKNDLKGSSLIANNVDNIVAVCKNPEKDKLRKDGALTHAQNLGMYDTEIRIEKQRDTGWEGRFLLRFDTVNFAYSPFTPPAQDEKPKNNGRSFHKD